jgi:hypothetical protein
MLCLAQGGGMGMRRSLVVCTGTGIREIRELAHNATEALRLIRALMKLRRPAVRIETNAEIPYLSSN